MKPLEFLNDWSPRNRGLAEALLAYEDSLGPHGIPWREALDPDMDGWFEVEEVVDNAQAALDRWHKDHDSKDTDPGTRLVVVNTRAPKTG